MPLSQSQLNPPVTRTSLGDFVKGQLLSSFTDTTQIVDFVDASNNRNIVLEVNPNPAASWLRFQYRISISNALAVTQNLQEGWNAANNTSLNNGNSSSSVTFSAGLPISSRLLTNTSEIRLLILSQGNLHKILGFIQPSFPNEIQPSVIPVVLQFQATNTRALFSDARTPYGIGTAFSSYEYVAPIALGGVNHVTKRDFLPFIILHTGRRCLLATGSNNLYVGAADGMGFFEQIQDYYSLSTVSPAVFVRP